MMSGPGTLDCQTFTSIFNSGCTSFLSALTVVVATILSPNNVNVISVADCKYIAEVIESEPTINRRVALLSGSKVLSDQNTLPEHYFRCKSDLNVS